MSATHVALLRGINVGRAKRVAMADLRALVEGLGCGDVGTLLNSGNVVFSLPPRSRADPAARIAKALVDELGVESQVLVIDAATLAKVIHENPLTRIADNDSRLMVTLLGPRADRAKLAPLATPDWSPEAFALGAHAAYLWCPGGIIDSPLAKAADRVLRDTATTRNWATIVKLQALLSGS